MPRRDGISMSVIRRMPRYYRYLSHLEQTGVTRISSKELSERMGLTASQIRQDLNCFGGFGQQGYGYIVSELRKEIGNILGLQNTHKAVVLGSGHLGQAVSAYLKFETKGFQLIGMFDNNPAIIGTSTLCDLIVTDVAQLEEFCQQHKPTMAVLCIPLQAAAELVAAAGIIEKAPVAVKAMPYCSIVCIDGSEMKDMVSGYLSVLYEQDPASVGGALPDDAFYYLP